MKVTEAEAYHYFDLMWGLQFFVNQNLGVNPGVASAAELARMSQQDKLPIRAALYDHPELIGKYVAANPDNLSAEDLAIVAGWRGFVKGQFYIERMLKKHAIFILNEAVYAVLALHDAFDEFFYPSNLPVAVQTVLLPYKGQIIYDGVMMGYPVHFGGGIKGELREIYMAAKQNGHIIASLEADTTEVGAVEIVPDYSAELEQMAALLKKLKVPRSAPPVLSPTFSLLRAALDLAELSVAEPNETDKLWTKLHKVGNALNRVSSTLSRARSGEIPQATHSSKRIGL